MGGTNMTDTENTIRIDSNYVRCLAAAGDHCHQCGGAFEEGADMLEGTSLPVARIYVCDDICAIDALDVEAERQTADEAERVAEWAPQAATVEVELRDARKAKEVRLSVVAEAWARLYPPDDAGVVVVELRAE
jgi:hypothetical protein